jgi:hypothetical protein
MDGVTTRFVILAAVGGIIAAVATSWWTKTIGAASPIGNGVRQPNQSGSSWTNTGTNPIFGNMDPDASVYANAPGRQGNRTNFNGQIFTERFKKGGPHNSRQNWENDYAFQTSTKNPFANGTNNSYARAVANATQDPTNQATSLVLGPGIAPND